MAQAPEEVRIITVGDRVLLKDKRKGEVKFVGLLPGKKSTYYGVVVDDGCAGENNGTLSKVFYFEAKAKRGVFVTDAKIKRAKPGPDNGDAPRVSLGSRVNVPSKESKGTVMFIGETSFKRGPIWYGVKLDKANGKNNGTISNRKYFTCKAKFGTFVPAGKIELIEAGSKKGSAKKKKGSKKKPTKKKDAKEAKPKAKAKKAEPVAYAVGDAVLLKPARKGEIRWIGEEKAFGLSEWFGVRLHCKAGERPGTCDGEFKDVRKFRCAAGAGVYVQRKLLVRKLDADEAGFDYSGEEAAYEAQKEAAAKESQARKDKKRTIRNFFKAADADGDFDIDKAEWKKMCNKLWPDMTPEEGETLFKSIDVSNSGEISIAEFEAYSGLDDLLSRLQDKPDGAADAEDKEDEKADGKSADAAGAEPEAEAPKEEKEKESDGAAEAEADAGADGGKAGKDEDEDAADAGAEAPKEDAAEDDAADAPADDAPADAPAEDAGDDAPAADEPAADEPAGDAADDAGDADGGDAPAADAPAEDAPAADAPADAPAAEADAPDDKE